MKAKTFWVARSRGSAVVRAFPAKPKKRVDGGFTYFNESTRRISGAVCSDYFTRITGIKLKMGDGPYRVTMTLRRER
jgi:hypothetical protein